MGGLAGGPSTDRRGGILTTTHTPNIKSGLGERHNLIHAARRVLVFCAGFLKRQTHELAASGDAGPVDQMVCCGRHGINYLSEDFSGK